MAADEKRRNLTRDDYLAGAAQLLAARGPVGGGRQLRGPAITKAAGITRSTLYRMWPSITDLCDDFAIYVTCDALDWRARTLQSEVVGSLGATIAAASAVPHPYAAVSTRVIVATVEDQPVRRVAVAAEAAWYTDFGRWLARQLAELHLQVVDGLTSRDLAIVVSAMVEGSVMLAGTTATTVGDFWGPDEIRVLAEAVDRLIGELTRPGAAPSDLDDGDPGGGERTWTERQRWVFECIIEAAERLPFDDPDAPMATRLVDLAALARQFDVTERRLYQLWPTASALNAELYTFQVERLRSELDQLSMAMLMANIDGTVDFHRDLLIGALHASMVSACDGRINGLFASSFALIDPAVASAAATAFTAWREGQQMLFLAGLHLYGFHLREGVTVEPYTAAVFAYLMGAMRQAVMDPSLLELEIDYLEGTYPLLAVGGNAVFRSLSDQCTHVETGH